MESPEDWVASTWKLFISSEHKSKVQRILNSFAVTPLPKGIKLGKDTKSGEYNTAPLPTAALRSTCSVVSRLVLQDLQFLSFVEKLKSSFNESAQRGPDFAVHA